MLKGCRISAERDQLPTGDMDDVKSRMVAKQVTLMSYCQVASFETKKWLHRMHIDEIKWR